MQKVYLIILDGFGLGKGDKGDAIAQAKTPFWDQLLSKNPLAKLKTHGRSVGLPEFQMGGSEMGHLTMGAGRPVKHVLTIINDEIEDGSFFEKSELKALFEKAQSKGRLHLVGMASDGGIHSFLPHLFGLQKMAKAFHIPEIYIHAFLDARDVPERSAKQYLKQIKDQEIGTIATVGGRYYAMDRDQNWERTEAEYRALCDESIPVTQQSWEEYINDFYGKTTESDYYLPPARFSRKGQIQADDTVICFNFRTDRMRQLMSALCDDHFDKFHRSFRLDPENVGVFGNYYKQAHTIYSLSHDPITNTLGEVLSEAGRTQLRICESEKTNHVTFFFSGEQKDPFAGEERVIVPSPKVPSYDATPEMAADEITDQALQKIGERDYDVVIQNYSNGDLVGHSGDLPATIKAVETLDHCLQQIVPQAHKKGYTVIITADHGNCEEMLMPDGSPNPSHSKNLVPCLVLPPDGSKIPLKESGTLADIAPTILSLQDLPVPEEMTGSSLLQERK